MQWHAGAHRRKHTHTRDNLKTMPPAPIYMTCSAWFRTTLLGVVIHMCRRHAAPTQAQVRLHWTAWCSDLSSVNYRRLCLSCCYSKGEEGLPSDVTSASSLSVFKNRLKTYLFCRCYDNVWLWITFLFPSHYLPSRTVVLATVFTVQATLKMSMMMMMTEA